MIIRIDEKMAETIIEGLEWISEDIENFHLDSAEYADDPEAEYDRLLAKEAAFDQAAATIIKAILRKTKAKAKAKA